MARPKLTEAMGREAVYQRPAAAEPDAKAEPAKPAKETPERKPKWEDLNTRATYHLPRTLVDAVTEEAQRSGRSKAQVVADALRHHLKVKG